jgi:hypothetical protein
VHFKTKTCKTTTIFSNFATNWKIKHQDSQGYNRQDVVWGGVGVKKQ